nr:platelet glycoprotein Ib alpha chain-like [Ipomoea batatas]
MDRVRKSVADVENNETIRGKEKESYGVEVQVLVGDKAAMSDVEKISTKMKILAAAIVKFGKAMAEVGSKNTGKNIIKKTFSKMSDMLNVASTSQPAETSTLWDDDPIFNEESFLATVSALEKAFIVTTNPAEHPKEAELDDLPSSPSWNLLTPTPRMFKSQMKQPPHALLNTMHLPISKRLKRAQQYHFVFRCKLMIQIVRKKKKSLQVQNKDNSINVWILSFNWPPTFTFLVRANCHFGPLTIGVLLISVHDFQKC